MADFKKLGKEIFRASLKSKQEGDQVLDSLLVDLRALNRKVNREVLGLYRSLTDRLDTAGDSAVLISSMANFEALSRSVPDLDFILSGYKRDFKSLYALSRQDRFEQMRDKELRLEKILKKMGIDDDRVTISQNTMDILNTINTGFYNKIDAIALKMKNFAYDTFFNAIAQSWTREKLVGEWVTPEGYLKIGSSLEGMSELEASIAAVAEKTAYLKDQAKKNGYTYCWNCNPMDQRTKPECIMATLAGVISEARMGTDYGFPPRYICRCEIVYTRGEWTELNKSINDEIREVQGRLVNALLTAPKQKTQWLVNGKIVKPTDPVRLSGNLMYADIEEKLSLVKRTTVPNFELDEGEL